MKTLMNTMVVGVVLSCGVSFMDNLFRSMCLNDETISGVITKKDICNNNK